MSEETSWYEDPFIQDMMGIMGARSMRSIMAGFKGNLIYSGENGIGDATMYVDKSLDGFDKRILVITDDFTKKFMPRMEKAFENTDFEFKLWDGVKPEVPWETIEEGVKTIVWLATIPDDGPNGGFFKSKKKVDW